MRVGGREEGQSHKWVEEKVVCDMVGLETEESLKSGYNQGIFLETTRRTSDDSPESWFLLRTRSLMFPFTPVSIKIDLWLGSLRSNNPRESYSWGLGTPSPTPLLNSPKFQPKRYSPVRTCFLNTHRYGGGDPFHLQEWYVISLSDDRPRGRDSWHLCWQTLYIPV